MRSTALRAVMAVFLLLCALALLVRMTGLSRTPEQWWYPFIPALFTNHYTAGPFAMTSNTREDNPVWGELPQFNMAQARLSYIATRGEPRAQIAWLLPHGEWKDVPVLPSRALDPNKLESAASRALIGSGVEYDRISRRDLAAAGADGKTLVVGHARYRGLLISDLSSAAPEMLANVARLARKGVPVVWLGELPSRADGWADHLGRDEAVREQLRILEDLVVHCDSPARLLAGCGDVARHAALRPADGSVMRLRMHGRQLGEQQFILLFNESGQIVRDRYVAAGRHGRATLMNPETGAIEVLPLEGHGESVELQIEIPANRTLVLHLAEAGEPSGDPAAPGEPGWEIAIWQQPPRSMYPFVRWWWPGNAVDKDELRRELQSLHGAGFGGVELQTLTLGFTFAELEKNRQRIYQVGTPAYFENLLVVFREAEKLGMTVDLTLGSGWSSGGPFIERSPEQQLLRSSLDVTGPLQLDVALPAPGEPFYAARTNRVIRNTIGRFDENATLVRLVAGRIDTSTKPATLSDMIDISGLVDGGMIRWDVPRGSYRIFALYQNATAHNACCSAYPGALESSPILDHLDRGGIEEYIEKLGEPWLDALAPYRPDSVFVDSFELIAELPWSSGLLSAFQRMHGYDLAPWLPLVFQASGESKYLESLAPQGPAYKSVDDRAARIREDYIATRETLFREEFLLPLRQWTEQRGVKLRLQAHGGYGDYLDSYQLADIPEAEGLFGGGSFDFLKLASSAAHVAGRPVVGSESFIKLAFDFDTLGIDDYHLLAGNAFAAGINRTICHGYAYHHPLQP